ncbi:helix-turn-helix domain-containing protein [Scytonema sp. PCC 10023]|uniref:AraC family transcriptional regulator n=1 Tax=Scytonema sp. PCC 10023 TaxID=1680591 RepID=UPI0039C71788
MPEEKYLKIDATTDELLKVLDQKSLLSSDDADWNSIHFQYVHSCAGETPEFSMQQPTIHIFTDVSPGFVSEHRIDGRFQQDVVEAGHIIVVPPAISYWCYEDKAHDGINLIFNPAFFARIAFESVDPDRVELVPHFPNKCDKLIYQIGLALKTELQSDRLGSRLYAETAATFLAAHLLRHYSDRKHTLQEYSDGLPKHKLKRAIAYIQEYLAENVSLEAIANELGMSRYYFVRLFKQSMGVTPYQYVLQQRIERAKMLLKQRERAISDIALECGFANQSHFTKHFRQFTGMTPKAYQNR